MDGSLDPEFLSGFRRNGPESNGEATPAAGRDVALLDAYSQAVVTATRRVAPAVVHLEIAQGTSRQQRGTGSGFIFTPDGLLLTNSHVVHTSKDIRVTTEDDTVAGDLIGDDP